MQSGRQFTLLYTLTKQYRLRQKCGYTNFKMSARSTGNLQALVLPDVHDDTPLQPWMKNSNAQVMLNVGIVLGDTLHC